MRIIRCCLALVAMLVSGAAMATMVYGYHDGTSTSGVSGWACDPDNFNAAVAIRVGDQSGLLGTATAGDYRGDVGAAGVCGGSPYHGYTFNFSQASRNVYDNQSHTISVYAIDLNTGFGTLLAQSPQTIFLAAMPNNLPYGWHDTTNSDYASGWTCDPDSFASALTVKLEDAGGLVGYATANVFRGDVASSCGGNGSHGFVYYWSQGRDIHDGQYHQVTASAQDAQTGQWVALSGSPQTVFMPMSIPADCSVALTPGQDIQSALNSGATTVCLRPGTYAASANITMNAGQTLRGLGSSRDDVVIASTADVVLAPGSNSTVKNLAIHGNTATTTYGVLVYRVSNVTLWSLRVQNAGRIGTGVAESSSVSILDTFFSDNGRDNGIADPNVWINQSHAVTVNYGELRGRANGPGGDGELSCFNSYDVHIFGTHSVDSGASAIYFVDCDSSSIDSVVVERAGEWGLDIVDGTDNVVLQNNQVSYSYYGGSVYQFATGGQYLNNAFVGNNRSGTVPCSGINVRGSMPALSGNSVDIGPITCPY